MTTNVTTKIQMETETTVPMMTLTITKEMEMLNVMIHNLDQIIQKIIATTSNQLELVPLDQEEDQETPKWYDEVVS
jgi:hypothetical protein